ncbi:ABC transporter permease subunit [Bacillus mobilis]|nr:ABC transporter permease [Bacillus mobilis]MCU5436131.1 ABC transporter permease subunit [Bacillus mobilis]
MNIFLFELKKMLYSNILFTLIIATMLIICGLFLHNTLKQDIVQMKKIELFSKYETEVFNQVTRDKDTLKKGPNAKIESRLEIGLPLLKHLNQLIQEVKDNKWKNELQIEMKVYDLAMRFEQVEGSFSASEKDMKKAIQLNENLLQQGLQKEDLDLSIQPSLFMKKVISLLLNALGFLILLLLLGTVITKEFEDHTIKLAYTLPISRSHYILIKFFSLLLVSLLWILLVFSLSYILPTIFGKSTGNIFNYPLFTKTETIISSGTYLKTALTYSLCYSTVAISLLVLIGFWIRNTLVTYLILTFILSSGFILSKIGFNPFLSPLSYQQIDHVILDNNGYYPLGAVVLIGSTFLLLLCAICMNRKRGV